MELSKASKNFKRLLPTQLQSIADVSMKHKDYFSIIINNLIEIYGDYANTEKNLELYLKSEEYHNACRRIKKLSKMPELTFEDIKRMVAEEDEYNAKVEQLLSHRKTMESMEDGEEKAQIIVEMGRILGIVPDSEDGLFTWLVNFRIMTEKEKEKYKEILRSKLTILELVIRSLSDFFIDGMIEEYYPIGSVMTQPYSKHFYRGEYAFFGSSKPGMYRNVEKEDIPFAMIIGETRIDECCMSFDSFDAVNHWGCPDVNYVALAQHYGLRTMMIDITSDLRTALFFACCKMDKNGNWTPMKNEDFSHRNSRKKQLGLGALGDSKYGILYSATREIIDIRFIAEDDESKTIIPVGYQPFMRCAAQSAYMLLAPDPDYDLYQDTRFEKYKFRLTEEICSWIFEEMQQGKKVYPYDDIPDIYSEVAAENKSVVFLEAVYAKMQNSIDKQQMSDDEKRLLYQYLADRGVCSSPDKVVFTEERIREINEKYTPEYAEKLINKPSFSRPMLRIPPDLEVEEIDGKYVLKNPPNKS